MSAARTRKVLLIAIAASLLLHLIFAGYFRWKLADRVSDRSETFKVREIRISRIQRTPPPTPPPTPAPVVRSSIAPPPIHSHSAQGPPAPRVAGPGSARTPVPTPQPATPAPAASHAGACVSANADPAVEATPDITDIPAAARASKTSGTAAIQVSLDPLGRVTGAAVAQSSGNSGLDSVAMDLARGATYTPKYQACKPIAGTYTFTVKFVAW